MSNMGEKIRLMRKAEGMTRKELAKLIDVSYGSLTNYETKGVLTTETILLKLTNHPRFQKYALWLMTGKTSEAAGQISPPLSLSGSETSVPVQVSTRKPPE